MVWDPLGRVDLGRDGRQLPVDGRGRVHLMGSVVTRQRPGGLHNDQLLLSNYCENEDKNEDNGRDTDARSRGSK